jgi:DNA helicase-2/ATP-dependent DNA helicase PcrA
MTAAHDAFGDPLEGLNEAQRTAVAHGEGPLLVLAGPGSGKTRVLTHRIAYLLQQGVAEKQLLALTFTNKAADEMKMRLAAMLPARNVWVSTFHRFCSMLLRRYAPFVGLEPNFTIYDASDSTRLWKSILRERQDAPYSPAQIARQISFAKNALIGSELYRQKAKGALQLVAAELFEEYQQRLLAANAVDFDDLLFHVASLFHENHELREQMDERYRYVLVDEYQDTNFSQYAIVRAISTRHPHLTVTGDPDQSIYGWRGASIRNILEFQRDFPGVRVVRLETNYRSTRNVLRLANALIAKNIHRPEKTLVTANPDGVPVRVVEYATSATEAAGIVRQIEQRIRLKQRRPQDVAILFRTNALTRVFEQALRASGIPYQIVRGLEFYQRKEVKDVLAYLQLLNNPRNNLAFLRVLQAPPRGIGRVSVRRLHDIAQRHQLCLWEAARRPEWESSLSRKPAAAARRLLSQLDRIAASVPASVEDLVRHVLWETAYADHLQESSSEQDQQRLENIEELLTAAREFDQEYKEADRVERFLEQAALVTETDDWAGETDRVTLMTLHAAKGLEFPQVFIVAVEQGILPHERSRHDLLQFEEERRLLFVGITRAQEELQLSCTRRRDYRGRSFPSIASPFLMEIPSDTVEVTREQELAVGAPPHDEGASEPARLKPHRPATVAATRVVTAVELFGATNTTTRPADEFHVGTLVAHPEYGSGKLVALSGSGTKLTATVEFFHPPGRRKFVLAASHLRPVKSP